MEVWPVRLDFSLAPVLLGALLEQRSQFTMVSLEQSFNPLQYYTS